MKKLAIILAIVSFALSCKAQSPIISIEQDILNDDTVDNTYVKDINNVFNPYFGTWKWEDTSTGTSFTIVFSKLEMVDFGDNYTDLLIGQYRFVKNGVEIFNSLNVANLSDFPYAHLMYSVGYISNTIFNFHIVDIDKEKNCKSQIELLTPLLEMPDGTTTTETGAQLQWRLSLRNAPYVDNEFSMYDYTSYPEFIILTKQ